MKKVVILLIFLIPFLVFSQNCEKWKIFEIKYQGPSSGNPFMETNFSALFTNGAIIDTIPGLYDGGGIYKIRFLPSSEGKWNYVTLSNTKVLNGKRGSFTLLKGNP